MFSCSPGINDSIPYEYRTIAGALFPPQGFQAGEKPDIDAAKAFAEILGIGADYKRFIECSSSEEDTSHIKIHHFLGHFQNNLDLLIQKTWVERADEARKERLQDQVSPFIAEIEQGNYQKALVDFSCILEELAYLFFGVQSHKEDFAEYVFRIDTQMGLFWWYGGQIRNLKQISSPLNSADSATYNECLKAILLIGICYLTNF
jgi:hypothetical protein